MIIHDVEQGTAEWHALRAGKPTASEFSQLITSTGGESKSLEKYAMRLAVQLLMGQVEGFRGNKHTDRGHELEPEARADYEMVNQVEVVQVGFITNNLMQYGCSPDGLVGKDGGYEAKCKSDEVHAQMLWQYEKDGTTPSEHIAQPQGCMFVTGRKWWDLHLYHPVMRSITIRQYPDKLYFKVLRKQLKAIEAQRNVFLEFLQRKN